MSDSVSQKPSILKSVFDRARHLKVKWKEHQPLKNVYKYSLYAGGAYLGINALGEIEYLRSALEYMDFTKMGGVALALVALPFVWKKSVYTSLIALAGVGYSLAGLDMDSVTQQMYLALTTTEHSIPVLHEFLADHLKNGDIREGELLGGLLITASALSLRFNKKIAAGLYMLSSGPLATEVFDKWRSTGQLDYDMGAASALFLYAGFLMLYINDEKEALNNLREFFKRDKPEDIERVAELGHN